MEIGKINRLEIARQSQNGLYLEDSEGFEVLLPNRYLPQEETEGWKIGDMLDVFVYTDSEDRDVATTETPLIQVGEVAALKVVASGKIGAFVDWGLSKDLLIPHSNQYMPLRTGDIAVVAAYLDRTTDRVVGTTKLNRFFDNDSLTIKEGEQVDVVVAQRVNRGYRVVINLKHWGVIYDSQIFIEVNLGDKLKAWVLKITEDKRVDVTLQQRGYDQVKVASEALLELMDQNEGVLDIGDKSDAQDIQIYAGMSKKVFKRAVGYLLKAGKVEAKEYQIIKKYNI